MKARDHRRNNMRQPFVFLVFCFLTVDASFYRISQANQFGADQRLDSVGFLEEGSQQAASCPDNCNGRGVCNDSSQCECKTGAEGSACETLNGEGDMTDLGIPTSEPCGVNFKCNNLNILRINMGMYILILEIWAAFMPMTFGYDEILCAQEVFPIVIFGLLTMVGGWLDLGGAAPHTDLQWGGIITNIIIFGISVILGMIVVQGKSDWMSQLARNFFEDHQDILTKKQDLIDSRQAQIDAYIDDPHVGWPPEKISEAVTEGIQIDVEKLKTKERQNAARLFSMKDAPKTAVRAFFFAIIFPLLVAFLVTDGIALWSGFGTANGGYQYSGNGRAIGLLCFLIVHWALAALYLVRLFKKMSTYAETINANPKKLSRVLKLLLLALSASHSILFVTTTQWSPSLPVLTSGTNTIITSLAGFVWMIILISAAIIARNGTDYQVATDTFFHCKADEERQRKRSLSRHVRELVTVDD